jgi:hypothetical protein
VKRLIVFAGLAGLIAAPLAPADAGPRGTKKKAGKSEAVSPEILQSIAVELERSMDSLQLGSAPKPYFVGYKVTEVDVNDVVASLGATTSRKNRHFAIIDSHVHVGNYQFDNSNFVIPRNENVDGIVNFPLPLEATPRIARRAAWLATDTAYNEALYQLQSKMEAQKAGAAGTGADSYAVGTKLVQPEEVLVWELETLTDLETRAQNISAVLRDEEHVRDSRVAFTSFLERRWYINSEGTDATDTRRVSGVIIAVNGQADDGQQIALYYSRYGVTADDLPGDAELKKQAEKLADQLAELAKAPVLEEYSGPVLFEGEGATDIVRYSLATHLGGTPLPLGMAPEEKKRFGGALEGKIGRRVLHKSLSVTDDPTTHRFGKVALIGGYAIDDEGVAAQSVDLINGGKLETLLTSRSPSKAIKDSNGHARRSGPGGVYHGSATNLFIKAKKGKSRKALRKALLKQAKDEGLDYAIIIRRLDDASVTAAPELSRRELITLYQNTDQDAPPPALLAYKVYPNGKEELVRGVHLKPIEIKAWKDLLGVGNNSNVANFLASGAAHIEHVLNGVGEGAVPSSGVESAIITPDLLFEELDLFGSTEGKREAPVVPRPK